MNFLPDVYVVCESCNGTRYNRETREIRYRGYSISDVLDMTVEEACELLENIPTIKVAAQHVGGGGAGLHPAGPVGADALGRRGPTGEAGQRTQSAGDGQHHLHPDEPTTALHFEDVRRLLDILHRLVDVGNTVIVIEHNLEVVKSADWIHRPGTRWRESRRRSGLHRSAGSRGRVSRLLPPARPCARFWLDDGPTARAVRKQNGDRGTLEPEGLACGLSSGCSLVRRLDLDQLSIPLRRGARRPAHPDFRPALRLRLGRDLPGLPSASPGGPSSAASPDRGDCPGRPRPAARLRPDQENDVYRYVLDGQVLLAGANPYEQSPFGTVAPSSRSLWNGRCRTRRREEVISRIGYAEIPTLYPPAAQAAFAAGGLISGWNWIGLRILFTLFDLALIGLIVLLLTRIGSSPARVLLYAWNPLVLKEVTNSVHVDVLPAFFVVLLMVSLERTRPHGGWRWLLMAAGSMAAGVLSKLYPILLLPAAFRFISLVSGGKKAVTFAAASLAGSCLGTCLPVPGRGPAHRRSQELCGTLAG